MEKVAKANLEEGDTILGILKGMTEDMKAEGGTGEVLDKAVWAAARNEDDTEAAQLAPAASPAPVAAQGEKKPRAKKHKEVDRNAPPQKNMVKKGEGPQHHHKHDAVGGGKHEHHGEHHGHKHAGPPAPDVGTDHLFTGGGPGAGPPKHKEVVHAGHVGGAKKKKKHK